MNRKQLRELQQVLERIKNGEQADLSNFSGDKEALRREIERQLQGTFESAALVTQGQGAKLPESEKPAGESEAGGPAGQATGANAPATTERGEAGGDQLAAMRQGIEARFGAGEINSQGHASFVRTLARHHMEELLKARGLDESAAMQTGTKMLHGELPAPTAEAQKIVDLFQEAKAYTDKHKKPTLLDYQQHWLHSGSKLTSENGKTIFTSGKTGERFEIVEGHSLSFDDKPYINFAVYPEGKPHIQENEVSHGSFFQRDDGSWEQHYIGTDKEFRGKGIARGMYDLFTEDHGVIHRSELQEDEGKAFWSHSPRKDWQGKTREQERAFAFEEQRRLQESKQAQKKAAPPAGPAGGDKLEQAELLRKIRKEAHQRDLADGMRELQGVNIENYGIPKEITGQFDAHGTATLETLAKLLNGGIDPSREFFSSPLSESGVGGYGVTVRGNSHFVVLGHPGETLREGGIAAVLVDPLHEASIPDLQRAFPGVKFVSVRNAGEILQRVAGSYRGGINYENAASQRRAPGGDKLNEPHFRDNIRSRIAESLSRGAGFDLRVLKEVLVKEFGMSPEVFNELHGEAADTLEGQDLPPLNPKQPGFGRGSANRYGEQLRHDIRRHILSLLEPEGVDNVRRIGQEDGVAAAEVQGDLQAASEKLINENKGNKGPKADEGIEGPETTAGPEGPHPSDTGADPGDFEFGANAPGGGPGGGERVKNSGLTSLAQAKKMRSKAIRQMKDIISPTFSEMAGIPVIDPLDVLSGKVPPPSPEAQQILDRYQKANDYINAFPPAATAEQRRAAGIVGGGQENAGGTTPPQRQIGLAKAKIAEERQRRGLGPLVEQAKMNNKAAWDEAQTILQNNPDAAKNLVDELASKHRATTPTEKMLLLQRRVALGNLHDGSMLEEMTEMRKGPKADQATLDRLDTQTRSFLAEIDKTDRVARQQGSDWGRSGLALQALMAEDYTLSRMQSRAEQAKGKPLTAEEKIQIGEMHEQIAKLQKIISEGEARWHDARPEQQVAAETFKTSQAVMPPTKESRTWTQWFKDVFGGAAAQASEAKQGSKLWNYADNLEKSAAKELSDKVGGQLFAGFDPTLLPPMAKYVAAKILKAGYTLAEFSKAVVGRFGDDIKPHIDDVWKQAEAIAAEARRSQGLIRPGGGSEADYQLTQTKAKFDAQTESWRNARASNWVKAWRIGKEAYNIPRSLIASIDFPLLRQGLIPTITRFTQTAKAVPDMFRAFFSEEVANRAHYEVTHRTNSPLAEAAGLDLTGRNRPEEGFFSRFFDYLEKTPFKYINFVRASERGYQTVLNRIRMDTFDAMVGTLRQKGKITLADAKVIANGINEMTGRGHLGPAEKAMTVLNNVFFAPKWVQSRFQVLTGHPIWSHLGENAPRARQLMAKEYARLATGFGVIAGLAALAGFDLEKDPRSSDFGKLKVGNTRLDFTGGLAGVARIIMQTATLHTKNQSGVLMPLYAPLPHGADDYATVLGRFARQKLAPMPAAALNLLTRKDVVGNRVTPLQVAGNLTVPLFGRDVYEAMMDLGVPRGPAVIILGLLGMSMNTYDTDSPRNPPTEEDREQLQQIRNLQQEAPRRRKAGMRKSSTFEAIRLDD